MQHLPALESWWSTEASVSSRLGPALLDATPLAPLWRATNHAIHVLSLTCAQDAPGSACNHTQDQHVLMFLGCRSLTSTLASLRLLLAGYYLQSLAVQRDVLESTLLLQLFVATPDAIGRWRTADARQRLRDFGASAIAKALAARGVPTRYDVYKEFCELATHPSSVSRILTWRRDLSRQGVGPFVETESARKVLLEITLNCCDACNTILDALKDRERFATEWSAIEKAIDDWNAAPEQP